MFRLVIKSTLLFALCVHAPFASADEARILLFPAELQGQAGPTPTVRYLTPSVLELETGRVPGTPSSKLYLPEGKRYWDTETGELIYGNLLDPDEVSAFDFSPEKNQILYYATYKELTLFDLSSSPQGSTNFPLDMAIQGAAFIPGTDLAIVDGFKTPHSATLCINLETGEQIWQSYLQQRTSTHFLKAENRFIEKRDSRSNTTIVRSWNAITGEPMGSIEALTTITRQYQSISQLGEIDRLFSIGTSATQTLLLNAVTGDSFTLEEDLNERTHLYSLSHDAQKLVVYYPSSNRLELRSGTDGSLLFDIGSALSSRGLSATTRWFGFSPDGSVFHVIGADGSITEWNTEDMNLERTSTAQTQLATAIGLTGDGKYALTLNAQNPQVEVMNIQSGVILGSIPINSPLRQISVSPDSSSLTILLAGGVAHTYSLPLCAKLGSYPEDQGLAYLSSYVSSRDSFLSYYHNGQVEERSAFDFSVIRNYELLRRINEAYAIDPKTGYILVFDVFSQVALFDPFTNSDVQTFPVPPRVDFASLVTPPEGPTIIALSGSSTGTDGYSYQIKIHASDTQEASETIDLEKASKRIELSPDATKLAYSTFNDSYSNPESILYVRELGTENVAPGYTLPGNIDDLVYASDSNSLFVLWHNSDQNLRISHHNPDTGELIETLPFRSGKVEERNSPIGIMNLFPDENKALVATAQNTLIVVDLQSGSTVAEQKTRPDNEGHYSSLEALRLISISGSGNRVLYQDPQGLQDSWTVSTGIEHPLAISGSTQLPVLSMETKSGDTYILEMSSELLNWNAFHKVDAEADETIELSIPEDRDQSSFFKAYRFSKN